MNNIQPRYHRNKNPHIILGETLCILRRLRVKASDRAYKPLPDSHIKPFGAPYYFGRTDTSEIELPDTFLKGHTPHKVVDKLIHCRVRTRFSYRRNAHYQ